MQHLYLWGFQSLSLRPSSIERCVLTVEEAPWQVSMGETHEGLMKEGEWVCAVKNLSDLLCDFQPSRIMESLMCNLPPVSTHKGTGLPRSFTFWSHMKTCWAGFIFSLWTSLSMISLTESLWTHWHSRMISTTASRIPCCNQATSLCISTAFRDTPGKCAENVNSE